MHRYSIIKANIMKTRHIISIILGISAAISCSVIETVKDPITITFPTPTEQIDKVVLTKPQEGYVKAGNEMAFRLLGQLYEGENMVCSPLSLQLAMAMTTNGASGDTLQEIIDFLGYGEEGIDVLNEYCKALLDQLPAVDLNVNLKVTDALIVNDKFPLMPSFKEKVTNNYYAAVDNMDFNDPKQIAARINDWSRRNTNGFIDKVIDPSEISENAVAYIMNALYFKAKWSGSDWSPMFREEYTKAEDFHLSNGKTVKVDMMRTSREFEYAEMDGYKVLVLPYAGYRFNMYILLPDDNDLDGLVNKLKTTPWSNITANLKQDATVNVRFPKFAIENKHYLTETLKDLGVRKAFKEGDAEIVKMFEDNTSHYYWIEKVIQKSRIAVSEWGTEAGSVTVVEIGDVMSPGTGHKTLDFYIDRPFAFIIGEETSDAILFEGTVTNP